MVKIKNIEEPVVKLFFDGLFVGEIKSGLSFYDVLSQIKEENVYGYSIEYNSEVINIDKNLKAYLKNNTTLNIDNSLLDAEEIIRGINFEQ
jgi:hypothetical protein